MSGQRKVGLTFAIARSFLRQDPDIIMVGEIQVFGDAEISIKAAQTGHMVMSTLHTVQRRKRSPGFETWAYLRSILLRRWDTIAQRLARRLCSFSEIPAHCLNRGLPKQISLRALQFMDLATLVTALFRPL